MPEKVIKSFYEELQDAVEDVLHGKEVVKTFEWEVPGNLGFKCWRQGKSVMVEIKGGVPLL